MKLGGELLVVYHNNFSPEIICVCTFCRSLVRHNYQKGPRFQSAPCLIFRVNLAMRRGKRLNCANKIQLKIARIVLFVAYRILSLIAFT